MTSNIRGYAAHSPTGRLGLFDFERRSLRPDDIAIEILYCGVCHSDVHNVRNDWGNAKYPMVPGHEIVGRVLEIGSEVKSFKPTPSTERAPTAATARGSSSASASP